MKTELLKKNVVGVLLLMLFTVMTFPVQAGIFPDVPEDHWAHEAVEELVVAGVIEGYPDGTYKGQQNMTRYEMAMIIARMLRNLTAEYEMLAEQFTGWEEELEALSRAELNEWQEQQVRDIVQAMLEEQEPEKPEKLTAEQLDQVVDLIQALTAEFRVELREISAELGDLEDFFLKESEEIRELIAELEARMDEPEPVTFRGSYSVEFNHQQVVDGPGFPIDYGPWQVEDYPLFEFEWNSGLSATSSNNEKEQMTSLDDYYEFLESEIEAMLADLENKGDFSFDLNNNDNDTYYFPAHPEDLLQIVIEGLDEFNVTEETEVNIAGEIKEIGEVAELEPEDVIADFVDRFTDNGNNNSEAEDFAGLNEKLTAAGLHNYLIERDEDDDFVLPDWSDDDAIAVWDTDFGFTQRLELGIDILTELFTAAVDLDIDGSDQEVSLAEAGLDLETENFRAVFNTKNEIDYRDYALYQTDITGLTLAYKPLSLDTFFGIVEIAEGEEEIDEFTFDYDYDREEADDLVGRMAFERAEEDEMADRYLAGVQLNRKMADFSLGGSALVQLDPEDFGADENMAVFIVDLGAELGDSLFLLDIGSSLPFDSDETAGFLVRAEAEAALSGIAQLQADVRWRDENFKPLLENKAVFDDEDDDYDRFADGLAEAGVVGLNLRVDQDLFDILEEGYGEFNLYDEDWKLLVGGGIPLFLDGLVGSASLERLFAGEDSFTDDTIKTGLSYTADRLELNLDFQTVMLQGDDRYMYNYLEEDYPDNLAADIKRVDYDANEYTFGLAGEFGLNDNISLLGSYEMVQNLANVTADNDYLANFGLEDDFSKQTLSGGIKVEDWRVFDNLTFAGGLTYSQISGHELAVENEPVAKSDFTAGRDEGELNFYADSLELRTLELNLGLDFTADRLSLNNDFTLVNKNGDSLAREGNRFTNKLELDYEILSDTSFTADYTEDIMHFTDNDDNWQTREIKAGIKIGF